MGSIECERPKNVQKIIVQWDIPPTYPNFKKNPLNLLQKKKKKRQGRTLTYCLNMLRMKKTITGYKKSKGLW